MPHENKPNSYKIAIQFVLVSILDNSYGTQREECENVYFCALLELRQFIKYILNLRHGIYCQSCSI